MTILLNIQAIPAKKDSILSLVSPLGYIHLCLTPVSRTSLYVSLVTSKYGETIENPMIQLGKPYLIVIRMIRNDYDITSLNSIQIGAAHLDALSAVATLKESRPLVYKNPLDLENSNTSNSYSLQLGGQTSMRLFWIHFFDYELKNEQLKKEALELW